MPILSVDRSARTPILKFSFRMRKIHKGTDTKLNFEEILFNKPYEMVISKKVSLGGIENFYISTLEPYFSKGCTPNWAKFFLQHFN